MSDANTFEIGDWAFVSDKLLLIKKSDYDGESVKGFPSKSPEDISRRLNEIDPDKITIGSGPIAQCTILLTTRCFLRCIYCSECSDLGNKPQLTIEQIQHFVDYVIFQRLHSNFKMPLRFNLTGGGEPTSDWLLFTSTVGYIEEKCSEVGIEYEIFLSTNGLLDDEKRKYLLKHIDNIMISYDGRPDINRKNRPLHDGSDVSDQVETSISWLLNNDARVVIKSSLSFKYLQQLPSIYEYIGNNFKTAKWSINVLMPMGRGADEPSNFIDADPISIVDSYLEVHDLMESTGIEPPECSIFSAEIKTVSCGAILPVCRSITLEPDGKIVTCSESTHKTVLGTVSIDGVFIEKVCSDPLLAYCQKSMIECKGCIAYAFCKGGCPGHRYMYDDMGLENAECQLIQAFWKSVLFRLTQGKRYDNLFVCEHVINGKTVLQIMSAE